MALSVSGLKRVFEHKETKLDDPDPAMTADQVLNFYTGHYPELTTATIHGPEIKEDVAVYKFTSTVGTKG